MVIHRFAVAKYDDPQKSLEKLEGSLKACLDGNEDKTVKDDWLDDQYVHLVNNSISAKNKVSPFIQREQGGRRLVWNAI